jgi:aspartate aminotransferase
MNGNTKDAFPGDRIEKPDRTVLILDYDGTLHDSMGIYEPAFRTAVSELEEKGWLEHRDYSAAEIRHWIGFSAGDMWKSFQPDFEALARSINSKTRAIIINSPNNPTGAVLTEESIIRLSSLLKAKEEEYGAPIYLISDEPYRELVYGDVKVPYLTNYYDDTIVCYSFSKSLSLPGERIGYVLVSPKAADFVAVYQAVCGAGRALGYVCAPSLLQKLLPYCLGKTSDVSVYDRNRKMLIEKLSEYGFDMIKPQGAFYLFIKSPSGDSGEFCERAKKHEILIVPSDDFGCKGYARLAYCVTTEQIERALPAFERLAKSYKE